MKVYKKFRRRSRTRLLGSGLVAPACAGRNGCDVPQIKIEGKRLADAGFLPGSNYKIEVTAGRLVLTLMGG